MSSAQDSTPRFNLWRTLGPAIITASVVLGPGSILSASRIGYQHGYAMAWILLLAVGMMIGMTALSARLGVTLEGTLCSELARRVGRWAAVITGVSLFLIAACFQFGNNLGVIAAIEPFVPGGASAGGEENNLSTAKWVSTGLIVLLNWLIIVALFGFQRLYQPVERLMKILVVLMIVGFAGNLVMARPDLATAMMGLVPQLPDGATETLLPKAVDGEIVDHLVPVIAMFVTTFSVGGAFYQSYLVRKKGWTRDNLREGFVDSTVGICILGLVTLMIMVTAAAVLHDNPDVSEPKSAADVARQLEPLFGPAAKVLFCLGIFAGAFSSFFVNAMIGGTILSDGLGLGGDIDQPWPKHFTVLALLVGMGVAVAVHSTGKPPVNLIIFAQAMTVLGLPALAATLWYLATRKDLTGELSVPMWMKLVAALALVIVTLLAVRTGVQVWLKLTMTDLG